MFYFYVISVIYSLIILVAQSLSEITRQEDEQRSRYIEYIDDHGVGHILDTNPQKHLIQRAWSKQDVIVKFFLYTKQNKLIPEPLYIGNIDELQNSNFNPNISTVFIVHGWWGDVGMGPNPTVKDAYLNEMDVNVIIVDRSDAAKNPDYYQSVNDVPNVGKRMAKFIMFLNRETGASYDNMHLIGHSLGGHVVGNAGRAIEGAKVARITALDPAGPLWSNNPYKLLKTDAQYVEAIHTNGGPAGLGTLKELGTANFYPNGGMKQPGCYLPTCSHSRAIDLFASTLKYNHLIARKCDGITAMLFDYCYGEEARLGNSDLTKFGSGVFRVETGSSPPFNV